MSKDSLILSAEDLLCYKVSLCIKQRILNTAACNSNYGISQRPFLIINDSTNSCNGGFQKGHLVEQSKSNARMQSKLTLTVSVVMP